MTIALLLLLGAPPPDRDYAEEARVAQLQGALEALRQIDARDRDEVQEYVDAVERGSCRSGLHRLKVQCLIEAARRKCRRLPKSKRPACEQLADILLVNKLSEPAFVTVSDRYRIMRRNIHYRPALRAYLRRSYATMATDFGLSVWGACAGGDTRCLARGIDAYCRSRATHHEIAWQHCAGAIIWFIGTTAKEESDDG